MAFSSILFDKPKNGATLEIVDPPAFFGDLNIDQIINAVVSGNFSSLGRLLQPAWQFSE